MMITPIHFCFIASTPKNLMSEMVPQFKRDFLI